MVDDFLKIDSSDEVKGNEENLKKIASNVEAAKVHLQGLRELVSTEKLNNEELERIISSLAAFAGETYERGIDPQSPCDCTY